MVEFGYIYNQQLKLQQLNEKFPTKKVLYVHMRDVCKCPTQRITIQIIGDYILPDYRHCNVLYLQLVLCGEKRSLNTKEHVFKKCPLWPELSAKKLMPILYQSPKFRDYMPNDWDVSKRELNRDFLYTLMFNVNKGFFDQIVQEAMAIRSIAARKSDKPVQQPLPLLASQIDELLNAPDFYGGKCPTKRLTIPASLKRKPTRAGKLFFQSKPRKVYQKRETPQLTSLPDDFAPLDISTTMQKQSDSSRAFIPLTPKKRVPDEQVEEWKGRTKDVEMFQIQAQNVRNNQGKEEEAKGPRKPKKFNVMPEQP